MPTSRTALLAAGLALTGLTACALGPTAPPPMGFFVTSVGMGQGANLGGLAGADRHCQALAAQVGAGGRTWRAYLSASAEGGQPAVHARERIGRGPWANARGMVIARTVDELHGSNQIGKATALDERGEIVNGRGDQPNEHDVLTGSTPDGRAAPQTCANWTSSGEGSAIVGHHDRKGLDEQAPARSWNASHPTRGGCSLEALRSTGGSGRFYCFATD